MNYRSLTSILYWVLSALLVIIELGYSLPKDWLIREALSFAWIIIAFSTLLSVFLKSIYFLKDFFFLKDALLAKHQHLALFITVGFLPCFILLFDIAGIQFTHVDTESVRQQGEALLFLHQPDLGVYHAAFLGGYYPNRQYILACYPSALFGPGMIQYRIGYATLFLTCYLAFVTSLAKLMLYKRIIDGLLIASWGGAVVGLADYTVCAARLYEQICLPISVAMLLVSALISYWVDRSYFSRFLCIWTIGFLPFCYTPALATFGLALLVVGYLSFRSFQFPAIFGVQFIAYALFALLVAFLTLYHPLDRITIGGRPEFTTEDWVWRYYNGLSAFVGQEQCVVPIPLTVVVIAVLLFTIQRRDFRFLVICLWALTAAIAALSLKGWCWREPQTDIGRSMVVLPVLASSVIIFLAIYGKRQLVESRFVVSLFCYATVFYMVFSSLLIPFKERDMRLVQNSAIIDGDEAFQLLTTVPRHGLKSIYIVPQISFDIDGMALYLFGSKHNIKKTPPPDGESDPNSYVLYFIAPSDQDRIYDDQVISHNRRPYFALVPESVYAARVGQVAPAR